MTFLVVAIASPTAKNLHIDQRPYLFVLHNFCSAAIYQHDHLIVVYPTMVTPQTLLLPLPPPPLTLPLLPQLPLPLRHCADADASVAAAAAAAGRCAAPNGAAAA